MTTSPSVHSARTSGIDADHDLLTFQRRDVQLLADALSLNAIYSLVIGSLIALGSFWLSSSVGVAPTWIMAIGVGTVAFGACILHALSDDDDVSSLGRVVLAADLGWLVGATIIVGTGLLQPTGDALLTVVSIPVAVVALAQATGLRRCKGVPAPAATPFSIVATRRFPVSPDTVWAAVADAGDYARHADGIDATTILSGSGTAMVRQCTSSRGETWRERCVAWQPGHSYRMEVDVSTYPNRLQRLLLDFGQAWRVMPQGPDTLVELRFEGSVRIGVLGRWLIGIMGRGDPATAVLTSYEQDVNG